MRCQWFRVAGYRSVKDTTVELGEGITVLIGANGAGKSNVIGAMELLGRVVDNRFEDSLLRQGGLPGQFHMDRYGEDAQRVTLEVRSAPQWSPTYGGTDFVNGYTVELEPAADGTALLTETTLVHAPDRFDDPRVERSPLSRRSRLAERAAATTGAGVERHIVQLASGIRVFHVDDTSPSAPALQRHDVADDLTLHDDAGNLAAVLYRFLRWDRERYDRIVRSIRVVAPFFDDFVLEPQDGFIQLRWREKGLDRVFHGRFLSSGTLRFMSLATLLLQDRRPAVIVLDEPELGLHPAALNELAELLRVAAQHVQIVAATQSVPLLDRFSVSEIAIVERESGQTCVRRPDMAVLDAWLDDYTTGELWEMTVLGGHPAPDLPFTTDPNGGVA